MTLRILQIVAIAALYGVLASGCASIQVGAHQDETASLIGYRTFTWITDDPMILAAGDQAEISPLTKKKIVDTIAKTFVDKGYTYTANRDFADFVVSYTVGTRERIDATTYPRQYDGAWAWHLHSRHYGQAEVRHYSYTKGTLGIDIFDGKSNQPVWHGWASKTISSADRDDPAPTITTAVESVLALFPSSSQ